MKNFKDFEGDIFTPREMVKYGIIVPICFVLTIGIAGWLAALLGGC